MSLSLVSIRKALEGRLETLDGGWKVMHEDVDFNPATWRPDRPREQQFDYYLSTFLLPAPTRTPGIYPTSPAVETGIFQIAVVARTRTGARFCDQKSDHVRRHFTNGLEMVADDVKVRVTEWPSVAAALYNGPWRTLPVSVPYQAVIAA